VIYVLCRDRPTTKGTVWMVANESLQSRLGLTHFYSIKAARDILKK